MRNNRETFTFNSSGQLTSIKDLNGYLTVLTYAGTQLSTVTDTAGRQLRFAFGANGLVSSVTDPMNHVVQYTYDAMNNLVQTQDPFGLITRFNYDATHEMTTMTDPNGGVVRNVFDWEGRIAQQTDPAQRVTGYDFTDSGTTITQPGGRVDVQTYVDGQLTEVTKASGTTMAGTWQYAYDPVSGGVASVLIRRTARPGRPMTPAATGCLKLTGTITPHSGRITSSMKY